MLRIILSISLFILFVSQNSLSQSVQLANQPFSTKQTESLSDDEYRIYELLINNWFGKNDLNLIVIDPEPDTCEKVTSNMDPKYSKVPQDKMDEIETYCGQLPKAAKIDVKRFHLQQRIALVTRDKQKSYFPETVNCEDGWKRYFLKYPRSNGYMSVSRIGFDHEKRFAGVYFSYIRGCLDAEGHNILLEKTGDGWKIAYDVMPWVS